MKTTVVKASKLAREGVSAVGAYQTKVQGAWEIYLAKIKRAESEYFETVKHAAQETFGVDTPPGGTPPPESGSPPEDVAA